MMYVYTMRTVYRKVSGHKRGVLSKNLKRLQRIMKEILLQTLLYYFPDKPCMVYFQRNLQYSNYQIYNRFVQKIEKYYSKYR